MKITIIGASAGIGFLTVQQALEKGYEVTAFSRDTTEILDHARLTKINGDATIVADIKSAIMGADTVIITIGTKKKKGTTLFSDTAKALIKAVDEAKYTNPVLLITGFGAGESSHYLNFFMRTVIELFMQDQYNDKTLMEELIVKSTLKWAIIRPVMLTNGALTKSYKVLPTLFTGMKVVKISRADVAHFLVREAENPTMMYQYSTLTR